MKSAFANCSCLEQRRIHHCTLLALMPKFLLLDTLHSSCYYFVEDFFFLLISMRDINLRVSSLVMSLFGCSTWCSDNLLLLLFSH